MGEEGQKKRWYQRAWVIGILTLVVGMVLVPLCLHFTPASLPIDLARLIFGPSSRQEAERKAIYDPAMEDLEEAKRTGDTSVLERRWCGEAREWAEEMVLEGDWERLRLIRLRYGIPPLQRLQPHITADEIWIKAGTEISQTNKVWLDVEGGCIIVFHPTKPMLE